jgi:hypothetical protein
MQRYLLVLVLFCWSFLPGNLHGQVNLVPNPSFEDTVFCPYAYGQVDAVLNWSSWSQSLDYFNRCAPFGTGVPNTGLSYQQPLTGDGMVGLITFAQPGGPGGPNYREIIGTQLISSLQSGITYYFTFYVNFGILFWSTIATNNIGLKCFTSAHSTSNPPALNGGTIINVDTIVTDTLNWIKVSGKLLADSAYSHVAIGNFFGDALTDTMHVGNPNPSVSYYFIENICISTDSVLCNTITFIKDYDIKNVSIYPNPVSSTGAITSIENDTYALYSSIGQLIKVIPIMKGENTLDFSDLSSGIYLLKSQNYKQKSVTFIKL